MASDQQLWGSETSKAIDNFPVSGERVPTPVVRMLGHIKATAARVNGELGLLDGGDRRADRGGRRRDRPRRARRPVPDRRLPDRLGHLVEHEHERGDREPRGRRARTPTTTSTWASRPTTSSRRRSTSPRCRRRPERAAARAREAVGVARGRRPTSSRDVVKAGRTHLMDAVPVTLGQEFAGYATQISLGHDRVSDALPRASQIPLGGTATGTGLNTHPEFAARVREQAARGDRPRRRGARPIRSRPRATATRWSSCRAR